MERSSSPDEVKNVDWISKLPDDVLLMILSRLSTEEAMRTSLVSKRWEHLWKQMSHLVLDMQRFIDDKEPLDNSNRVATLITEVLNNHHGHLESCEEKSIAHEEFMKTYVKCLSPTAALAVSVDLMSRTEVERLRQLLCLWPPEMEELEISFKDCNGHREEDEYLWEEINNKAPFPNAEFRVGSVWMYNFSGSEEEFALASCLVRQGTVVSMMMVKSTSYPASKKLKIEAAVAKLQALLPDDDDDDEWEGGLIIECF
ncbi:hypothetical protein AALP_AA2G262900 [Arabis alpina]|uniref:F-box domain-containing protein n=1 Tax=Arabis alpina TaxID=50452 RepID=A0A087HK32_ARAAL|nr:hypothetical protein AALP_AA2G262900 [Arabis alpina]